MPNWLRTLLKWLAVPGVFAIVFMINAIAEETVQEVWNTHLEPKIVECFQAIPLKAYIALLVVVMIIISAYALSLRNQNNQLRKVGEFYESLFLKLSVLNPPLPINDPKVVRLTSDMLKDLGEALDGASVRSYILIVEGDWLVQHSEHLMPASSGESRKFYIGTEPIVNEIQAVALRGVAGTSFCQETIEIDHVSYEQDRYVHDHARFLHRTGDSANPGYSSFICVPMILGNHKIGVLCVDSLDRHVFDSSTQQDYLEGIAVAFAGAFAFATGNISVFSTEIIGNPVRAEELRSGNKNQSRRGQVKRRHQNRSKRILGGAAIAKRFRPR